MMSAEQNEALDDKKRIQAELLEEIRSSGGQKTFAVGMVSTKVFRYLFELQVKGVIEQLPFDNPLIFTYRLKS